MNRRTFLATSAAAAAVSLLVGGIGIMNFMLVSVSERRQEIGLRMAIGARRSEIGLQFLIEAGLLALLGSGAGVVLALGATVAFAPHRQFAIRRPAWPFLPQWQRPRSSP